MATRKSTKKTTRKTATTRTQAQTPTTTRQRTTRKTTPSSKKNTPPATPASSASEPQSVQKSWRVFPVSDSLRQSLKNLRDAAPSQMSLRDVVTFCVQRELPQLVAALRELQCDAQRSMDSDRVRPIRMQVDVPTLDLLRTASNAVGLPAQTLMLACCRLVTSRQAD